ncbi:cation:proton antiporter [Bacteroides pyogenes]|uniref:Sodium:proton antiporter n=3 Tax=Bacteroides pyogenes TaxID=310300 RepID=A0A5D3EA00_9BACE|nr:cation:proton antiporter [Bacteroides pyogenes]GAE16490.1 potassium/proton antiporter rosb [Bacteroides pyogenes JCM 6292]MBR8709866.1 Glutathione-regulated potassium-efflux system protein KefB [Bacteroides pyogenes]MBR8718765.1 Glutathione-regulated potassium-efflux system protein KefB [Bacteroides pyogenes]MBR8748222.1 Glutathione-regulated potassium-efflux system protein KefB [Bacteroides pyogenes]MBR8758506.1 Glutathione-regulated potassium-efflux system protein KefB [Bacteroides pyogen
MSHLPTLIADLALILICAGVMTLLFKKLKQPLVLGYVVAGFLASPHMPFTPSVMDTANIKIWADIGVIFLLFALGLEFSFKKIVKVGGSAVIAACTIIFCMILLGIGVGMSFGWHRMDCLFLGGMIAMSSTTIIYKAFDDLGLRKKQFTGLVLSILILEDILAIVLMVMLSTMAASHNFEGSEMLGSIAKLVFFLILWFVVGIYLIPLLLRRARKLMSEETLLITSLALCFGMVVLASHTGFSAAFGAFIMGSILAETIEAESIERLVKPVKDLFGAIFFVSVGMMVDPEMIIRYALPIFVITVAVILGQAVFGTLGVILSGKPLKTAMQCGFSLTQIGEFAFIIASLGVSLRVTSDFLYPVVVAVSVITTFLTPYMIRIADPVSTFVDNHLPVSWQRVLRRYSSGSQTVLNHESLWKNLLLAMTRITVVYSIVSISVITLSFRFVVPLFKNSLPHFWASLLGAVFIILCISPFLRAIMVKKNHSVEFTTLWHDNRANRAPLIATIVIRVVIAALFVAFVIAGLFKASVGLMIGVAVLTVLLMVWSRRLKKQSILIERRFFQNLRSREVRAEYLGEKKPAYAGRLLSHDLHLADMEIPGESPWAGRTLADLNFGKRYGIHIVSILRGKRRINIPGGSVRLFPFDKIQVIGTDELLNVFSSAMSSGAAIDTDVYEKSEMVLKQLLIDENSIFLGKTVRNSGIRDKFRCLVAGVEREDGVLMSPDVNAPFEQGDVVWVVGEKEDIYELFLHQ